MARQVRNAALGPVFHDPGEISVTGGCRTTSRSALSSRTLGTYRPQSARPIRTVVYVPGANCGLTRGDGGLCDSLGGPGSGSGAQEPVLSGSGAQEPVLGVVRPA